MRRQSRITPFKAGVLGLVIIGAACYLVFGGGLPFGRSPFVLKALFTAQTQIHLSSPVRVSGVNVGAVVSVEHVPHSAGAAVVTMNIDPSGLPVHADATVKVRPRIFLEGNYYIDLFPGRPSAPTMHSGDTLPAANTSGPVQLDRVLAALNTGARSNLSTLLRGLGSSLDAAPSIAADASADPLTRGLTGGQALGRSLDFSVGAFQASSVVNQALLGSRLHDLSGVVSGNERLFRGLSASPGQLSGFISTFNATVAALAARQQQLSQTISVLPPLLRSTSSADTALDASFAPTRAFAAQIIPGLRQLDPTIGAALPWLAQSTALASPQELGGLLSSLTPAVQNTARALGSTRNLLSAADLLAQCFSHNVIPTGNQTIADAPVGSGQPLYREFFQSAVGIAGSAGNFDGNGRYTRASIGGGSVRAQTPSVANLGPYYGNFVTASLGTRPAFAGSPPPLRRDVPCYRNAPPQLNRVSTGVGP